MAFERGDQNVSAGYFRSVAYFYLEQPVEVDSPLASPHSPKAEENKWERPNYMLALNELERMNNFEKAADYITEHMERYPEAGENGVLALRRLEHRRLLGEDITDAMMQPFLDGTYGEEARNQARMLQWFYAEPNRALIVLNSNGRAQLYLDGKPQLQGDHPLAYFVKGVEIPEGKHHLAASVEIMRQSPWLLAGIRTHNGVSGTGPGTLVTLETPQRGWTTGDIRPEKWKPKDNNAHRGPPDLPFIGSVPNAFVLLTSKVYALGIPDWPLHGGKGYFLHTFELPLSGYPDFAPLMTGLSK
jgi:hypothetical protein